jgi:hypothetical protein
MMRNGREWTVVVDWRRADERAVVLKESAYKSNEEEEVSFSVA